jgi:hypothetical protein
MRRTRVFLLMMGVLICFASVSHAAFTVTGVELVQVTGASSYYDADTGTLTWSLGASGAVMTGDFNYAGFTEATISATLTGGVDATPLGGYAAASFTGGTWSVVLGDVLDQGLPFGGDVNIGGTFSFYNEAEVADDVLQGSGVVTVDYATFDLDFFGGLWSIQGIQMQWGDGNGLGGLFSQTLFTPDYGLTDYNSDFSSDNLTVTLVADETTVPESMTVILLGLGALSLRKRR